MAAFDVHAPPNQTIRNRPIVSIPFDRCRFRKAPGYIAPIRQPLAQKFTEEVATAFTPRPVGPKAPAVQLSAGSNQIQSARGGLVA
jgi:hypothetical protein